MKSPRRTPRKRPVEKGLISATAVVASTTPFLEEGTHHQDRASTSARRRPSSNVLEEDHDIWDLRGRALGAAGGPIGREVRTARALELMNQQMVSSTRCGDASRPGPVLLGRPRRVSKLQKKGRGTSLMFMAVLW